MPSGTFIHFLIRGEFDPDDLAGKIALTPSRSAPMHWRNPATQTPPFSILRYAETRAGAGEEVVDVYALADAVHEKLRDHTVQIAAAIREHDAEAVLQVVLDFPVSEEVSTPVIGFSGKVVRFLAEVGASIDIDTYRA